MAEIAVLLVVKKIGIAVAGETLKFAGPVLAKKSELVAALPNDMRLIKNELELIHAFLKGIGRKGGKGEVIETWIGQVRRLAYDMEDIVDQFIYVVGKHNQKGSWWDYTKKIVKKPRSLFSLDEIATEVKRINQELKQLSESRDRWTRPLDGGTDIPVASYETEQELYLPGHDYSINDEELVGTDKNRQTLIDSLHFKDRSLRIIAVWGMGGIGKSTLVNSVYKNEVSNFDCRAWVSISQSYKLDDVWKKMLRDLAKDKKESDPEKMNSADLREELTKILDKQRYLIILDDAWTAEVLFKIREVLVDNGLGSRVIITTRIEEVASIAEDGCKIKLEPLNEHDAWFVFCRKAFPKVENHICPPELHQCGIDIVEKCDGLPLALVAIGSILSLKMKSAKEWRLFYNQLIWEVHSNENLNHVEKILNLSYKYLPDYLKNCFLYCAMFPEDYLIYRKRLIRLWIAEGFIEQKGTCSLEDIAEGYLGELVRRSMLQVVERNSFDRIKCLRMHDLVRELAIFQSRKESFSTTYDDNHWVIQAGLDSRRVSVLQCSKGIPSIIDPSRLRTIIAFDTSMALSSWYSSSPSQSKYLAVLDLSGMPIEAIPKSVGELFNLRLLCLDDTNVKELPKSITKLQNLQTLSLEGTQLLSFPRWFSKLTKLRYLGASRLLDVTYSNFIAWESVEPFKGFWNLNELQTLFSIKASEVFVAKLGNLSQLRALLITDVRSSHCAQLCDSLSKMQQLSLLHIRACDEDEVLQLDDLTFPNPLQKFLLWGRFSEGTLESPFFLNHGNALLQIHLYYCQLTDNQLSRLSELSGLTELWLSKAYTGQKLHFSAGWSRNLKRIILMNLPHVNQICIHEGVLINLEDLHIQNLQELRDVPIGVDCLTSLKQAYFIDMHSDFVRNVQRAKLDNIPDVYSTIKVQYSSEILKSTVQREMAEIAVLLVVKKIGIAVAGETLKFAGPLLAKKSELVAALPNDMRLIKNELELIHAFLKGIGRKGGKGEVIETWIGQVRRLAYDMEDIVDQFIYVVGKHNRKGSWWDYTNKIVKKPRSLFSLDEIATEVKRINQELKQLSESRDRWTRPLDGGTDIPVACYETEQELYLPGHDYSINDDELVGTDKNRQTLIDSLRFEDRSLRIIAVWGMGGIGKSTLVNSVYKNEVSNFDCRAWVSISQSYKLDDVWKKMLRDLLAKDKKEFDFEMMNTTELRVELTKILEKRQYLIILDDVWTAEVLFKIREVLVDNGLGSRVIITTRMEEVASVAEDGCKIKVEPLNVKELPKSITKLRNLQTLSLEDAQLLSFPRGFSELTKLRYLYASRLLDVTYSNFISWESVEPFKGIWNLNELQTLGIIKASEVFVAKLGNLSQLRSLLISDVRSSHCVQLCDSLSKMQQLSLLHIRACNEDEVLQLDDLTFPNPLQKLSLWGRFSEGTLKSPFFLNHGNALLRIRLGYCHLTENQLSRLSELSGLTELDLSNAYNGQQLHFSAGWSRNLKTIILGNLPHVNQICIHEGALINLEDLHILNLQELRDIPIGVDCLASLKQAYFIDMHSDFAKNLRRAKLDNIPNVYLTIKD
ncbi:disease resistance protein RPM1-like [Phragmites australis]|uniref:disease resistance protein RPM1-like n=1 Tax=Phragmites australis TaxID=29695 RepID=UPI002D77DAE8|nr:disease resistance protein RPM1-like [Phragmites australis]